MKIVKSSKYNSDGEFWHDGRQVEMVRQWGGIGFHGPEKFCCVVGEEHFFGQIHYYILAEAATTGNDSYSDLLDVISNFDIIYKIQRWVARLDKNVDTLLEIYNKKLHAEGRRNIVIHEIPSIGEEIDELVSLVHRILRPKNKRLHFFGESMLPAHLYSVPREGIRAEDHPAVSALASAVAGLQMIAHEPVRPEMVIPVPEGDF